MIKASHAIPKRIHRDTVFLYHSGYLREGSIPGAETRSEDGGLGKSGSHSQSRNGHTGLEAYEQNMGSPNSSGIAGLVVNSKILGSLPGSVSWVRKLNFLFV